MIPDDCAGKDMEAIKETSNVHQGSSPTINQHKIDSINEEQQDINDNDTNKLTNIPTDLTINQDTSQANSNGTENGSPDNLTNGEMTNDAEGAPNTESQVLESKAVQEEPLSLEVDKDEFDDDARDFSEDEDKLIINEGGNDRRSEGSSEPKNEETLLDLKVTPNPIGKDPKSFPILSFVSLLLENKKVDGGFQA